MKRFVTFDVAALAVACTCVLTMGVVQAQLAPYLPAEAAVKDALLSSPLMQAARAKKKQALRAPKALTQALPSSLCAAPRSAAVMWRQARSCMNRW